MTYLQQLHDNYIAQLVSTSTRLNTSKSNTVNIKPVKLLRHYPRGEVYKRLHSLNGKQYNRIGVNS